MPDYYRSSTKTLHTSTTIAPAEDGTPTLWSASFEPIPDLPGATEPADVNTEAGEATSK